MTEAERLARKLEDNRAEVREGAKVDAIYRPTGTRSVYHAHKGKDGSLVMRPERFTLPETSLDSLVILKVLRRGFGK